MASLRVNLFSIAIILIVSFFNCPVFGQRNYGEINREIIIHGKNGTAKTNSYHHQSPNYDLALQQYLYLLKRDSNNIQYLIDIAFTYFESPYQKTLCIPYCLRAINSGSTNEDIPELYYPLGISYRMRGEYEKAIEALKIYSEKLKGYGKYLSPEEMTGLLSEVNREIDFCIVGKDLQENFPAKFRVDDKPYVFFIKNSGKNINSVYDDYNPVFKEDTIMLYTSRRNRSSSDIFNSDGRYYEDIYTSTFQNSTWSPPDRLKINTPADDAVSGISKDNKKLFIINDSKGRPTVKVSEFLDNKWTRPKEFKSEHNEKVWGKSMAVAMYDTVIYFVSNLKGGFGGKDIYKSVKSAAGEWSLPINLGPTINTSQQEESPFFSTDGNYLYFASTGHNSMGGFDMFRSKYVDGAWTTPENLLTPINSENNELDFSITKNGRTAFLSSQRLKDGRNDMDVYEITFFSEKDSIRLAMVEQDECPCPNEVQQSQFVFYDSIDATLLSGTGLEYIFGDGKIVQGDKMDSLGRFPWRTLSYENPYSIRLIDKDSLLSQKGKIIVQGPGGAFYTMVADEDNIFRVKGVKSKFYYTPLNPDKFEIFTLEFLDEEMTTFHSDNTDYKGEFCYEKTKDDNLFAFKLNTEGPFKYTDTKIVVPAQGNKTYTFIPDEQGIFRCKELMMENLPKDTVNGELMNNDSSYVNFSGKLYYNSDTAMPATNMVVLLIDKKNGTILSATTGNWGEFLFQELPKDKSFLLMMDVKSPGFKPGMIHSISGHIEKVGTHHDSDKFQLFMPGENGKDTIEVISNNFGQFSSSFLPFEYSSLSRIEEEPDTYLKIRETIADTTDLLFTILLGYDKSFIEKKDIAHLDSLCNKMRSDKLIQIQITGHTDSKGTEEHNLMLSKQRSKRIENYILSQGIKGKQIEIKGFGELYPVAPNELPDGSDNPEGRRLNRRVDIRIKRK